MEKHSSTATHAHMKRNLNPAERMADLGVSMIRQIAEAARPDAISLGVGEPTWDLPEPGLKVLNEWSGRVPYGSGTGMPELRRAVARFHNCEYEETMITVGSVGALFSLLQAWVGQGDKVLIPDPGFVTYRNIVRFSQSTPVFYPLDATDRFRLEPAAIISRLDDPTIKAVILNHPSNPTGAGASAEALAEVAAACERRGVLLISDEVYGDLFLGQRPPSLRDVSSYGIVTCSVSKAWAAPGLRVGWAVGDPAILAQAQTVHSYATTCPAITSQRAALALVESSDIVFPAARKELSVRWQALEAAIQQNFEFTPQAPDGTFYYFMRLPETAYSDPVGFAIRLRDEANVVTIPGLIFGEQGREYVRISFVARPEQIAEAIKRIARYWRE